MSPTTKVSKKKRHRRFHCGKLLPMMWGRMYHHRSQHNFQTTSPRTTIQRPCPFVLPLNLDLTMQQPPHRKREPNGPVVGCNAEAVNCRYHRHQRLRTQHRLRCFRKWRKQEVLRRFQLQRQWGWGICCTNGPTIAVCLNCRGNLREGRKHCCIPLRISCSWVEKNAASTVYGGVVFDCPHGFKRYRAFLAQKKVQMQRATSRTTTLYI